MMEIWKNKGWESIDEVVNVEVWHDMGNLQSIQSAVYIFAWLPTDHEACSFNCLILYRFSAREAGTRTRGIDRSANFSFLRRPLNHRRDFVYSKRNVQTRYLLRIQIRQDRPISNFSDTRSVMRYVSVHCNRCSDDVQNHPVPLKSF